MNKWRNLRLQTRRGQVLCCASLGLGLVLAFCISWQAQSMLAFASTCDEICSDTLRLHILANSDSEGDQALKLAVRDAVLVTMQALYQQARQGTAAWQGVEDASFAQTAHLATALGRQSSAMQGWVQPAQEQAPPTKAQSIALVCAHFGLFQAVAQQVVAQQGEEQQVTVSLSEMYFDTTVYDTFTLPAGRYTALRIELGAAEGKNWFCVLYPALCLSSACGGYDTAAENEVICGDYALRFAVVEWYQSALAAVQTK